MALVICVGITWGASLKMKINRISEINTAGGSMRPNNLCFKIALQMILYATVLENIALMQPLIGLLSPLFNIPDKWSLAYS